jgi:uncharacterized pyridoxal phosphate-containing UPF0001 family protein
MSSIPLNLQAVRQRIESATRAAGRPAQSVRLLAVSKTFPPEAVREAAQAGLRDFGENYVQEGVEKIRELASLGLTWHYIGPIQSNKTRAIAEHFDWVHSIDRAKIAKQVAALTRLKLRGLMAVPEPTPDEALQRRRFAQLRELRDRMNRDGLAMDMLSMGMSADLEAAIAEGATLVRVGTAIFGERQG